MASTLESRGKIARDFQEKFTSIALSGMATQQHGLCAEKVTTIRRIRTVQLSAAAVSGAAGVTCMLGTIANPTKFAVWNSATSASAGAVTEIRPPTSGNTLAIGEVLTLRIGTGKKGAGVIAVYIECAELL